jgi:Subtilase family
MKVMITSKKAAVYFVVIVLAVAAYLVISKHTAQYSASQSFQIENVRGGSPALDFGNLRPYSDLRPIQLQPRQEKQLAEADLRGKGDVLCKTIFNTRTPWPPTERMPEGFDPEDVIRRGMNPGLGVRELHRRGITGRGVAVAIIDQPLPPDHDEYRGKIVRYTTIDVGDATKPMHGPGVTSLLVGNACGTAPEASLYYWAEPSWKADFAQRTKALEEIMAFNRSKPAAERIRVVSVSIGFSPLKNLGLWKKALKKAAKSGLVVVHCSLDIAGLERPLDSDPDRADQYLISHSFERQAAKMPPGLLYVPMDGRTVADPAGPSDYTFWAAGGLSWTAPYVAGVIALGFQVDPELKAEEIFPLLKTTGTPFRDGVIINPPAFVDRVAAAAGK